MASLSRQANDIKSLILKPEQINTAERSRAPLSSSTAPIIDPPEDRIIVRAAQQHNLKKIDVEIPRLKLVVITGPSGCGKSSLAFDTIYAEGQRRYAESLSPFIRQYLDKQEKPKVEYIYGLSPAIAIQQKTVSKNPRSTVGSITEIGDYLRLMYSRIGRIHCMKCGEAVKRRSIGEIVTNLAKLPPGVSIDIYAPIIRRGQSGNSETIQEALRDGWTHAWVNGSRVELRNLTLDPDKEHEVAVLTGTIVVPELPSESLRDVVVALVTKSLSVGSGVFAVGLPDGDLIYLSPESVCANCGTVAPFLTSAHFSSNTAAGMCKTCNGLGTSLQVDPDLIIGDASLSILDGAIRWYGALRKRKNTLHNIAALYCLMEHYGCSMSTPWKDLPQKVRDVILFGSGDEALPISISQEWSNDSAWSFSTKQPYPGLVWEVDKSFRTTKSEDARAKYSTYLSQRPCSACHGTRMPLEVQSVTLGNKSITESLGMTVDELIPWLDVLYDSLDDSEFEIGKEVIAEIRQRLEFMMSVGLHYLSLDRPAPTLSGGEGQRIRLASQLSCGLVGVLYVLDEPSIGLHPRDQRALVDSLLRLRDLGNTVLVVEHDEETMRRADWIIDMGPRAGILGGQVIATGSPAEIASNSNSLTGRYLSGDLKVGSVGMKRRPQSTNTLRLTGASLHNLKKVDVEIPIGLFTCITGVSGSGKSSLINGTLVPALAKRLHGASLPIGPYDDLTGVECVDKVINITQDAIGRTPRSNPATYSGLFDEIRSIFAATAEAQTRGYQADRFSFNVPGGRCETCEGHGQKHVEMHFLADVWITCQDCNGTRYNADTLAVKYKGKTIAEVLDLDVQEALPFFAGQTKVENILETLHGVGLDYLKLGQSATTLSGGEAQRIKLAKELSRKSTGRTMYVLDEPTTGLHFEDVRKLLDVIHRLVDGGNTVLVIEHNLDVIGDADWVIDIGPVGGKDGGYVIATGPPGKLANIPASETGKFLTTVLASK